jgi:hypothetical protein
VAAATVSRLSASASARDRRRCSPATAISGSTLNVVERYLELGLSVGRHVDELVENFYGPKNIKERVDAEEPLEPARLVDDAAALLAALDDAALERDREQWLRSQLTSLHSVSRRLAGETFPYPEQIEREFGIRPTWVDEREYERAHAQLDEGLSGPGTLLERFRRWLAETALGGDALLGGLQAVAAELRERTRRLVGLPDGEELALELASDKHWAGYNLYCGGLRSRVWVNTDLPFPAADLAYMVAHEGYPGHHTEGVWKETTLVSAGRSELTLILACGGEAVIAEAIAELGRELVLPGDEQELVARVLEPFGVRHDAAVAARIQDARKVLRSMRSNLALLLFDRGASDEEAREYVTRWGLLPEERVTKLITAVRSTPLPGYVHCYTDGLRLANGFVEGDAGRFKRLLTEQLVPADLAAGAAS